MTIETYSSVPFRFSRRFSYAAKMFVCFTLPQIQSLCFFGDFLQFITHSVTTRTDDPMIFIIFWHISCYYWRHSHILIHTHWCNSIIFTILSQLYILFLSCKWFIKKNDPQYRIIIIYNVCIGDPSEILVELFKGLYEFLKWEFDEWKESLQGILEQGFKSSSE